MTETYVTYLLCDGCRAPGNLEYNGKLCGQRVREVPFDRDALLTLADEIGMLHGRCDFCINRGECDWADEAICLENMMDDFADRIREALGVEHG